jgi:hypothetical protein
MRMTRMERLAAGGPQITTPRVGLRLGLDAAKDTRSPKQKSFCFLRSVPAPAVPAVEGEADACTEPLTDR